MDIELFVQIAVLRSMLNDRVKGSFPCHDRHDRVSGLDLISRPKQVVVL